MKKSQGICVRVFNLSMRLIYCLQFFLWKQNIGNNIAMEKPGFGIRVLNGLWCKTECFCILRSSWFSGGIAAFGRQDGETKFKGMGPWVLFLLSSVWLIFTCLLRKLCVYVFKKIHLKSNVSKAEQTPAAITLFYLIFLPKLLSLHFKVLYYLSHTHVCPFWIITLFPNIYLLHQTLRTHCIFILFYFFTL